ncbi:hypothetical protein Athai_09060 [Actinocatenispora thailandica]|uniref:Uncharacterized protein n=1 Tax=Actinocatenispora thailandica TaxID=227318 RepID=A0A7R7DKR0_9ACTN|nr:hypothetical protein Athai_09060 [Actinocatenispora thailandica]
MLVGVAIGVLVGAQSAARAERAARQASAGTHPYRVVLLRTAPAAAPVSGQTSTVGDRTSAPARWRTPAGTRTGTVQVAAGTPAGARVTVWFDARGHQTTRPESRLGTVLDGIGSGLSVSVGTATAGALLVFGTRLLLDRRRLRDWDRGWQRVEPIWSRRPRRDHRT